MGADAINKVKEQQPDVVLLDITMPAMSGSEAAQILKRDVPRSGFDRFANMILFHFNGRSSRLA